MKYLKKIKFDTNLYNFQEIVYDHFKKKNSSIKKDISNIHKKINFNKNTLHNLKNIKAPIHGLKTNHFDIKLDQKNKFVIYFYEIDEVFNSIQTKSSDGKFYSTYLDILKHLEKTFFKEKIIVQSKPTLRVHIPNNLSVGSYHVDNDYGHPTEAINMWLPFNKAINTSALWLESEPGKKDFKPYNLDYGEILIFDSKLTHGTEINREDHSRLSMDFRIIKKKDYSVQTTASPINNIKFNLGGYFKNL